MNLDGDNMLTILSGREWFIEEGSSPRLLYDSESCLLHLLALGVGSLWSNLGTSSGRHFSVVMSS